MGATNVGGLATERPLLSPLPDGVQLGVRSWGFRSRTPRPSFPSPIFSFGVTERTYPRQ